MLHFLISSLVLAVAILIVSSMMDGIRCKSFGTAFVVALVMAFVQAGAYLFTCGLSEGLKWLTLGLVAFLINAFGLFLADQFLDDFEIDKRQSIFVAAIGVTLVNLGLRILLPGV
ncbi:MAG: phage holin family protein [Planctomycetota bacterium]